MDNLDEIDTPPEFSALPRNDDDLSEWELVGKMKRLLVDPPQGRFFGKSRYGLRVRASNVKLTNM